MTQKLILAVPKGRIAEELVPLMKKAGIVPEKSFFDDGARQLRFSTSDKQLDIIRVRSFDVAAFVHFGAAALGVVGKDVLMEYQSEELYAPLDLGIGRCRLSVAGTKDIKGKKDTAMPGHVRVATKYPETTRKFYAARGIQAECIKLSGAMELAPTLGLCRRIVDLVSTGKTLKENGLHEIETIADISSYLVVNRVVFKTYTKEVSTIIKKFEKAVHG